MVDGYDGVRPLETSRNNRESETAMGVPRAGVKCMHSRVELFVLSPITVIMVGERARKPCGSWRALARRGAQKSCQDAEVIDD